MSESRSWVCQRCTLARRLTYRPPPPEAEIRCRFCGDPPAYLDYYLSARAQVLRPSAGLRKKVREGG